MMTHNPSNNRPEASGLGIERLNTWLRSVTPSRIREAAAQFGASVPKRLRQGLVGLVCVCIALVVAADMYARQQLPSTEDLKNWQPAQSTLIYASDGRIVSKLYRERRTAVPLSKIPLHVVRAFLAAEDAAFFDHAGLDYVAIVRAALNNLLPDRHLQGGSTITQQTVKALITGSERSLARKIKEALLSLRLESELTKNEILAIYLNQIYFGAGAYGVEEAAQTYFGKSADQLKVAEGALLAGLPKSPNNYNPRRNPEDALRRRRYVLEQMAAHEWLTDEERSAALDAPLELSPEPSELAGAPHYTEHVRRLLTDMFDSDTILEGGLRVYTGLDREQQERAHASVRKGLDQLASGGKDRRLEAALVALDPTTRDVTALVGGYDLTRSGFNRATQARRQVGSTFKPIVYGAALSAGVMTPATICADAPVVVRDFESGDVWKPKNYSGQRFAGMVTYRTALMQSINTCSVRLAERVGLGATLAMARSLGIGSPLPEDYTVALGSADLTPLELANTYATIASGGIFAEPVFIRRVEDARGTVLFEAPAQKQRILSPQVAYVLTDMLRAVVTQGTGSRANALERPVAGKTGTSNESRNLWFSGFAPDLVSTVWVGYDDNAPARGLTGSSGALPLWVEFMAGALTTRSATGFDRPDGVDVYLVDPVSGRRTVDGTGVPMAFVRGTAPASESTAGLGSIFDADVGAQTLNVQNQPRR